MTAPCFYDSIDSCIDQVFENAGKDIVLGIPLGIGKPNALVNALYRKVKADPRKSLKIITALSLGRPKGHGEFERRFLEPLVERIYGDYPELDYVSDMHNGGLPENIEVSEFFMKTGEYLNNRVAQQSYIYSNYSHAARDIMLQGVNVLAQAVACRERNGKMVFSLSSNPDITRDLMDLVRREHTHVLTIGVVNNKLPFMPNEAEVPPDLFDCVVTDPAGTHDLFCAPNQPVSLHDYAIGLHCASLVPDGGTLQIGIGSLGDAVAQSLLLRDQNNRQFARILHDLSGGHPHRLCETGRLEQGLYGSSEMFVNGFLQLIRAGVIRREVFSDPAVQRLLNEGRIGIAVTIDTVVELLEAGAIRSPLNRHDVAHLRRIGVFRPEVKWEEGGLAIDDLRLPATLDTQQDRDLIAAHCLGDRLSGGIIMHGGFFIGPRDFYQGLRDMPEDLLAKIDMCRIGYIAELFGQEEVARLQRKDARFINTTMMVTLLGAAVSDSLESGALVSGVGGQYNFVAQAHALPGARSVLNLRSTRFKDGRMVSNIVWNYGHTTIPRHLRDIVVTEYGIADLRGQNDSQVIKRMLAICDSRFQQELLETAKRYGKIPNSYEIPVSQRQNLPDVLKARLQPWREMGLLPELPFGTDMTSEEVTVVRALRALKGAKGQPVSLLGLLLGGFLTPCEGYEPYLSRMGLFHAAGFKEKMMRYLLLGGLVRVHAGAKVAGQVPAVPH